MFYYERIRMMVVKMLKKMQMFWRVPCFGCALHQLAIKVIYLTLRPPPKAIQCKTLMPDEAKFKMQNAKKNDLQKRLFIPSHLLRSCIHGHQQLQSSSPS